MFGLDLKHILILCMLTSKFAFAAFPEGVSKELQLANNLNKIEKYILDNEVGVKNEMIRAHTEISLILTELQKSCYRLRISGDQLTDSVCRGIGNMMYETMARQNYFIQTYHNLRIYILPMEPPIELLHNSNADINQYRYLFFNLIEWVNLNRTQKRLTVLLELMNFSNGELESYRFAAAASIYYGLPLAPIETLLSPNAELTKDFELFAFQQENKIFFSATRSSDSKSTIYITDKDSSALQARSCPAYKDYPSSIWTGLDLKSSQNEACGQLARPDSAAQMPNSKTWTDSSHGQIVISEHLKILLRCGK